MRLADLNVESEVADAAGELGCGPGWITPGEMVGAEILLASAVGQHVVGGGQDGGRDHQRRANLAADRDLGYKRFMEPGAQSRIET